MTEASHSPHLPFHYKGKKYHLRQPHHAPKRLRHYKTRVYNPKTLGYDEHPDLSVIVHNDELYINKHRVSETRWGADSVSWNHYPKTGLCTSGVLHFSHGHKSASGTVYLGSSPSSLTSHEVIASIPATQYPCYLSPVAYDTEALAMAEAQKYKDSDSIPNGFLKGFQLEIGTTFDDDKHIIFDFKVDGIQMKDDTGVHTWDGSIEVKQIFNPDIVAFVFPTDPLFPASIHGYESWDGAAFYGVCQKVNSQLQPDPKFYAVFGKAQESAALHVNHARDTVRAHSMVANAALRDSIPLSVEDLHSVSADPAVVQKRNGEILNICMKYCMDDDTFSLFNEERPPIDRLPFVQPHIEDGREFFKTNMAIPFVASGVSSIPKDKGGPESPITPDESKKVDYYQAGNGDNCMSKDLSYNSQNQFTYLQAYVDSSPRLRDYLQDQKARGNATFWADQLYEKISVTSALNLVITQMYVLQDYSMYSRYMVLLHVLDRSGNTANKYQTGVVTGIVLKGIQSADLANKESNSKWLPDMIQQFITKYQTDPGANAPQEAVAKFEVAQALKQAAEIAKGFNDLAGAISDAFAEIQSGTFQNGSILERVQGVLNRWAASDSRWAKIGSKLGKALLMIAWGAGLFAIIHGFGDWSSTNIFGQVALVADTLQLCASFVELLPTFGSFILESGKYVWKAGEAVVTCLRYMGNWLANTRLLAPVSRWLARGWNSVVTSEFGQWISQKSASFFAKMSEAIDIAGEAIATFFAKAAVQSFLKGFVKILGPVVAIANAAYACYTFIKDLIDGNDDHVGVALDGVMASLSVIEVGIAITAAVVEALAATLAVVGVVLAIIGIIILLVDMFRPKPKPESPLDKFMRTKFRPWVQQKDAPPVDWQPPTAPQ